MLTNKFVSTCSATAQGKLMKRIAVALLLMNVAQSADVVTVDPSGVTTVAGTAPVSAPGVGEVKIGGGQIRTGGNVHVNGTVHGTDIKVGTGLHGENHKLILWGPNTPAGEGSHQALSFEFAAAGSAQIRAYRGGSWDTYLQFLTNSVLNGSSTTPAVRMHISESGNVGIGTTTPSSKLEVNGTIKSNGGSSTGSFVVMPPSGVGSIANGAVYSSLEVRSGTAPTDAAFMTFHRSDQYAYHFGMDTDNILKIGGWSFGTAAYRVMLGDGYVNQGPLSINGALSATSVIINGNSPNQAGGIAMLDSSGKLPAERLPESPGLGLPQGYQAFTVPGEYTFEIPTVPNRPKIIYICVIGGGGGAGGSKPPSSSYGNSWYPGGKGGDGGRLISRISVIDGQNTVSIKVGGFGVGGVGGGGDGDSSINHHKNTTGGGGGGGGSQVVYNGITLSAGGGGGGGGSKNGYTGYSNRAGNGGSAMTAGETVPSYGNPGGAGATIGTLVNGGLGGSGGSGSNYLGQPGANGNSGGFVDHPFGFLFGPTEIGSAGQGGQPNLVTPTHYTPGYSGKAGAVILRW